jgi:hypothetical protein
MNAIDVYIVYKILKILSTPWAEMPAFQMGIVDANGKVLKKQWELTTYDEKSAYTILHRFVFNLKRLLERIPGGKSRLASYAAAMFLLREEKTIDKGEQSLTLNERFERHTKAECDLNSLFEAHLNAVLKRGRYKTLHDVMDSSGNPVSKGDYVVVMADQSPKAKIFGLDVYTVIHERTKRVLVVSYEDIQPA